MVATGCDNEPDTRQSGHRPGPVGDDRRVPGRDPHPATTPWGDCRRHTTRSKADGSSARNAKTKLRYRPLPSGAKIGLGDPADDVDRITTIMQAMGPGERCWFDVNRAWTVDQVMQVVPGVAHLTPLIEQPCETYEECRIVSQRTGLGLMLDESIDGADAFIRARRDGVMDVAALKFNATGGVGRHRFLAQLGVELGVPMRIEDFYGTGITLAAVTHIAHTIPRWATFGLYDYHLPAVPVVRNPLPIVDGTVQVPAGAPAGLGVDIDLDVIGPPVFETRTT